jgi:hypothetical protein
MGQNLLVKLIVKPLLKWKQASVNELFLWSLRGLYVFNKQMDAANISTELTVPLILGL